MIKCLIVDDEPIAHQILQKYILDNNELSLIGHARNAMEAIAMLEVHVVDLIFLDVQMPLINGLTFLKNLSDPPKIIFTTAHQNYAVKAFDLNAVDYLLKPFSYERFQKAVEKTTQLISPKEEKENDDFFIIENGKTTMKLFYNDVLYIEALRDYMKFYTMERQCLQHTTMKRLEETLPSDKFIRVHKSFIVTVNKIKMIDKDFVILHPNITVPTGQPYRQNLLEAFKK